AGGLGCFGGLPGGGLAGGALGGRVGLCRDRTANVLTTRLSAPTGTKSTTLRLAGLSAGMLEDVHITSYTRLNRLIVSAPPESMNLIKALIRDLDVPPAAKAQIKVFPLKKADATIMEQTLAQIFLGSSTTTTAAGG